MKRIVLPGMLGGDNVAHTVLPAMGKGGMWHILSFRLWWEGEECGTYCPSGYGGRREGYPVYRPPYPGGHTIPVYMGFLPLLGEPQHAHGGTGWSAQQRVSDGATVTGHRAQAKRNPWVRASCAPRDPKGVREERHVCAELFRSPCTNRMNDRVPQGTIPVYGPMSRTSAQSGNIPDVLLVAQESSMSAGLYVTVAQECP